MDKSLNNEWRNKKWTYNEWIMIEGIKAELWLKK